MAKFRHPLFDKMGRAASVEFITTIELAPFNRQMQKCVREWMAQSSEQIRAGLTAKVRYAPPSDLGVRFEI
jgi:hypothetical protein